MYKIIQSDFVINSDTNILPQQMARTK